MEYPKEINLRDFGSNLETYGLTSRTKQVHPKTRGGRENNDCDGYKMERGTLPLRIEGMRLIR